MVELRSVNRQLIGEILVKRGMVTLKQLEEALALQKNQDSFIGEILIRLGYVEERDVVVALVVQCGLPYIAVNKYEINPEILKLIPEDIAQNFNVIPLDKVGQVLSVVMSNPLSQEMKDKLEKITGCKIAAFISTKTEIQEAIRYWYKKIKK